MVGHNDAYCRFVSHHTVLDCPAAQSRYWNDYPDVAIFEEEELAINPGAGAAPESRAPATRPSQPARRRHEAEPALLAGGALEDVSRPPQWSCVKSW